MRVHAASDSDAPVTEGAGASRPPLLSGALRDRALHLAGTLAGTLGPLPAAVHRDASLAAGSAGLAVCNGQLARTRSGPRAAGAALTLLEEASALLTDVGGGALRDANEFRVGRGEHGVRVTSRRPDHVVFLQPGVHQGPDRAGVADRGDAADGLACPFSDRTGVGSTYLRNVGQPRYPGRIHAMSAASHDEQRRPVRTEHQAVGDRTELTAQLGGRGRGRRRALGQFPHLAGHT
jgi:hypothetical protein